MRRNKWLAVLVLVALPPSLFFAHRALTAHDEEVAAPAIETSSDRGSAASARPLDGDFDRAMKRDTARARAASSAPP